MTIDGITVEGAVDPYATAKHIVTLTRVKKAVEAELDEVDAKLKKAKARLLAAVDNEEYPKSSNVDGASIFLRAQVWAGPAHDRYDKPDHDRLSGVLGALGLVEYQPSTVNTQSLSAYIREELKKAPVFDDDGHALTLEERARLVLPISLVDALNLTEKRDVRCTGA